MLPKGYKGNFVLELLLVVVLAGMAITVAKYFEENAGPTTVKAAS